MMPPIMATGALDLREHDVCDEGECYGSVTISGQRRGVAVAARTWAPDLLATGVW
jgi:hypothetical protein